MWGASYFTYFWLSLKMLHFLIAVNFKYRFLLQFVKPHMFHVNVLFNPLRPPSPIWRSTHKFHVIFLWHSSLWILPGLGICSFTHCSFAHFAQIKWGTVSDSLRSLKTNERLWANRSGHSRQMSNRERIAQVAHDKWVTVSDLLRSFMINEQMSNLLKIFWLKNRKSDFSICFIYVGFLF